MVKLLTSGLQPDFSPISRRASTRSDADDDDDDDDELASLSFLEEEGELRIRANNLTALRKRVMLDLP